jgi:hypothetical protein
MNETRFTVHNDYKQELHPFQIVSRFSCPNQTFKKYILTSTIPNECTIRTYIMVDLMKLIS